MEFIYNDVQNITTKKQLRTFVKYSSIPGDECESEDPNEISDNRTLYISTGEHDYSEIKKFCLELLDKVEEILVNDNVKLNRNFRINVVMSISNNFGNKEIKHYLGWSIVHFVDPRVVNIVLGKDKFGETLTIDQQKIWSKTPPKISEENKSLITLPLLGEKSPNISLYKIKTSSYKSNSLIGTNVPKEITRKHINNIFNIYSYKPLKIKIIPNKFKNSNTVIVTFDNYQEALIAKGMCMILFFKIKQIFMVKFNLLRKNS